MKFPKEKKLKKYLSDLTDVVIAGYKKLKSLSKAEQMDAQAKKELFGFLPPQTKRSILLQVSGTEKFLICLTRLKPIWKHADMYYLSLLVSLQVHCIL